MAGKDVSPEAFRALRHVSVMPRASHLPTQSSQPLTPLEHLLGANLPKRNIVCHASGFIALPDIVAASNLVAIVPIKLVRHQLEAGTLATLTLPIEFRTLHLYLFWHESRDTDPAHRWIVDLMADVAATI